MTRRLCMLIDFYQRRQHPLISRFSSSPPKDWDPFVKQTYSAWVNTENGNRKWHLSMRPPFLLLFSSLTLRKAAYYTQRTEDRLGTIDDIPVLRDIVVPSGYFLSNADIRSNKPVEIPHNPQRPYNPTHQAPRPLHHTHSPDLYHPARQSPYPP